MSFVMVSGSNGKGIHLGSSALQVHDVVVIQPALDVFDSPIDNFGSVWSCFPYAFMIWMESNNINSDQVKETEKILFFAPVIKIGVRQVVWHFGNFWHFENFQKNKQDLETQARIFVTNFENESIGRVL